MKGRAQRRRGLVAVQVGVAMTVIVGFAALTIDVGVMYNAKADLQRTADAAALAAAAKLADFSDPSASPMELARSEALEFTRRNFVFGQANAEMTLEGADVEFGRAIFNPVSGSYDFMPVTSFPDAVRVRVRMDEQSANRALSLYFARIFGKDKKNLSAEATAMMVPRDIAIVADLSGSHTDDSELRNYRNMADGSEINMWEVWDAFSGGIGDPDSGWLGTEHPLDGDGYSPQMAGPAWGNMKALGFGDMTIDTNYDPTSDSGLVRLPRSQNWNHATLENALVAQGYSGDEVDAIMSGSYDSDGAWDERVAVALGFARWDSGKPGGLWQQLGVPSWQAGNGNDWVGGGELVWTETFGNRSVNTSKNIFQDYINNYADKTWTSMYQANSAFRYRFGIKTFMNYLMERRPYHHSTPEFADAPTQPMQAVKDAVGHLVDTIYDLDTDDHLSLEVYDTNAYHEVDLTDDYNSVKYRLLEMQAAHYDSWTNMGGGILRAREELSSERARPTARKVMFLLTDGMANVTADGRTGDYYNGPIYARQQAQLAVNEGIRIFCVSVGSGADTGLMQEIAEMGSGIHFHAEGSIDAYSQQLEAIFRQLGGIRPVELIN